MWAIPGLFFFIFVFSIQSSLNTKLPTTGFELRISGAGRDCSANCATTTAQKYFTF